MFFLKIHFWVVLRSGAPHIGAARVAGEEEDDVGLLRIRVEKRRQYGQRGQQRRKSSDRNLVQFGAIWCNLVQFGAIPGRELQFGWFGLHLLSSKLHLMASRFRLGTEMGRLFDPQDSL
jgi:hypothetical protein